MLLADNLFVEMAGVFEYDLELKEKGEHRKFLTQTASFKQVGEGTPTCTESVLLRSCLFLRIVLSRQATRGTLVER